MTNAIPLSHATLQRLQHVFSDQDLREARELLERDCAENIAGVPRMCDLDRIRFAMIKLSRGTIAGLVDAMVLAQTDFRDALMAADFGEVNAHRNWWPE